MIFIAYKKLACAFLALVLIFLYTNGTSRAEDVTAQITAITATPAAVTAIPPNELEKKISLDLRNIDLLDALKFLSMKAQLNIVPTRNVTGRVSLSVQNVPVGDVLNIMLRSNNLAYDKKGSIYSIMTEKEYKALYGKSFSDPRKVEVFRLKYAIPEKAFNLLDAIKSEIGRLLVDAESGTVMIMDTPEKIKEARIAVKALEQESDVKIFKLQYAKAKQVEEMLKSQLNLKKIGYIKADVRSNQVVVQTLPERMKNIEKLIRGLDKKTQAVLVDTKIIRIGLSDQLDRGIEWEGLFSLARQYGMTYLGSYPFSVVQSATAASGADGFKTRENFYSRTLGGNIGGYPFSGTTSSFSGAANAGSKIKPGERIHIGVVDGKRDFDVVIKYMQTLGKTKILSNPTLTIVNNETGKIHIGERRAFVTTTTTTGASTSTVSEEVTYVDVGVRLSITPTINEDRYVTMKVKPEISSIIGTVMTTSGNPIPILDTSTAETTVIAKDGSTVVLGGLGKEEKTASAEQVPFFGKLPLVGMLFSSSTKKVERTELVIMLTPHILEGDKLVTSSGREKERFDVKPFKEFDVYRGNSIMPVMSEASSDKAKKIARRPQANEFTVKGYKGYASRKKISAEEIYQIPLPKKEAGPIIPKVTKTYDARGGKAKMFMTKGFKPYAKK